jgi:hypothetical protein
MSESTDKHFRDVIENCGAIYLQTIDGAVFFRDRQTGAKLSLWAFACTRENILPTLKESRERVLDFPPLQKSEAL